MGEHQFDRLDERVAEVLGWIECQADPDGDLPEQVLDQLTWQSVR